MLVSRLTPEPADISLLYRCSSVQHRAMGTPKGIRSIRDGTLASREERRGHTRPSYLL